MISLREFKVSADGRFLTVDVIVDPSLDGVYISTLRITQTGDFEHGADLHSFDLLISEATNHYTGEKMSDSWGTDLTKVWLTLDLDGFATQGLPDGPFFMQATALDPESSATLCAYKKAISAVTFNKYPLYKAIACAAHAFDGCEPPVEFLDFLMRLKALEASVQTGSWNDVIEYYNWLIKHVDMGHKCMGNAPMSSHMPHHTPFGPPHPPIPYPFPPHHHGCGCHH